MIVEDEEYAKKILNDISYFRLIKAYSLNLKPKNGNYVDKVTFEQLLKNRIIENKNIEKTP